MTTTLVNKHMVSNTDVQPRAGGQLEGALGKLLSDSGKISETDVQRILQYARTKGLRFGEAAVRLRLVERTDVDRALATQFDYPYIAKDQDNLSRELIAAYNPFSPKVEALRSLRVQLMLGSFAPTANALAIVSPSSRDGRSFIAANLAVVFSQLGERTLLVDAHMQNSRLHEIFGMPNAAGLSSALVGRTFGVLKALNVPQFKNLSLVPGGPRPPNVDELLARDNFAKVCGVLRNEYDVVLFDTPAGDSSTGVDWIADRCGKALLVVRQNQTQFAAAKAFVKRMKSRAEIVGSVLNRY
jgi:protein-tyrosine kinase